MKYLLSICGIARISRLFKYSDFQFLSIFDVQILTLTLTHNMHQRRYIYIETTKNISMQRANDARSVLGLGCIINTLDSYIKFRVEFFIALLCG